MRRINTPIDKSGKLTPPRQLHPTQKGYLCPVETPEGQSVGVVKNLSFMTQITVASSTAPLYEIIVPEVYAPSELSDSDDNNLLQKGVRVFLNGCWLGIAKNPLGLEKMLKIKKHTGAINIFTSIVFMCHNKELRVQRGGSFDAAALPRRRQDASARTRASTRARSSPTNSRGTTS